MATESESRERRVTVPEDIWKSLKYYAHEERVGMSDDVRGVITPEALMWEMLKNHLKKMGHYPPKGEEA
jgi:hypothetical protein